VVNPPSLTALGGMQSAGGWTLGSEGPARLDIGIPMSSLSGGCRRRNGCLQHQRGTWGTAACSANRRLLAAWSN